MQSVVQFPRPAEMGATRFVIWRWRVRYWICRLVHWFGLPGMVRDFDTTDTVTGNRIRIMVRRTGTTLWINGREYHFDRLSGKLTGTGMQVCWPR